MDNKKTAIVIHHSLTDDGKTLSWQAIRDYHIKTNGWRDIAYHYGIELVNDHVEILVGRMIDEEGAHCKERQMNHRGIGICIVGNFDQAPPPKDKWDAAVDLTKALMRTLGIPAREVYGHGEICGYKSCPGKLFDMNKFRAQLGGL